MGVAYKMGLRDLILESLEVVEHEAKLEEKKAENKNKEAKKLESSVLDSVLESNLEDKTLSIEASKTTDGKVSNRAEYKQSKIIFDPRDKIFMENLRTKLLILFEGLQNENLQDKKLDLTIGFLQYELCLIEEYLNA